MSKETLRLIEPGLRWGLTEASFLLLNNIRMETQGRENFEPAREKLADGSLIVYFNHTSFADPGIIIRVLEENLKGDYQKLAFFASKKHLDPNRTLLTRLIMEGGTQRKNITVLPVVQHYDRASYSEGEVFTITLRAFREARRILNTPGGILVDSLEGTRKDVDTGLEVDYLKPAQKGVEYFLTRAKNSLLLPIGIVGAREFLGKHGLRPNPLAKVEVRVGKPFSPEEIEAEANQKPIPPRDILMLRLRDLLPEEMWGVYAGQARANLPPR